MRAGSRAAGPVLHAAAACLLLASAWALSGPFAAVASEVAEAFFQVWNRAAPGGVVVTYFEGADFQKEICRRAERRILKEYGFGSPAMGVPRDGFSSRWEGWLRVPDSGDYVFFGQSMDGLRVYVGSRLVLDNWRENEVWRASGVHGTVHLEAGDHPFVVEHYDSGGFAALRVKWWGKNIPRGTVVATPFLSKKKPR